MEERRAVSRRLYRVLEEVGASEKLRQLHRETATVMEITDTVGKTIFRSRMNIGYHCGSSYEGTVTPDLASDRDIIWCLSWVRVVHDVNDAPPGRSLLVVRDSYTYPGYVKLQLLENGQPLAAQPGITLQKMECELDSEGRVCGKRVTLPNMKGPAGRWIDENGIHYLDHVPAFRCATIPPFALEWFQKQRTNDRFSQEQLRTMSRMGCMFVGAGHVNSMEKDIEWRMSFPLQERLLMSHLNAVQHKVYLLLKMIKKNILSKVFNHETLTSYHCKTCVLFAVQMTPAGAWTDENLINCLLQCLKLMIKWLESRNCPNYFVNDQNLFANTGFPRRLRNRLLHVIRVIVKRDTQFIGMLHNDNIKELLRHGDCRRYRELSAVKVNKYTANLKLFCVKNFLCDISRALGSHSHDPVSFASTLNILQRTESINEHTTEVTQSSLAYVYPWLHLHTAKALVSQTHRNPDAGSPQQMLDMADFHFYEARDADLVNERLARAAVLYKAEQLEECFLLLQQVENQFVRHVALMCPCSLTLSASCYDEQDIPLIQGKIADLPIRQVIKSLTASCVVFLPSEFEIVPAPLQHEMRRSHGTLPGSRFEGFHYWFDWAVVDPRIYLYFMQYLVSSKLNKESYKQVSLDNLHAEIELDAQLFHRESAYNLLGWIHAQEGRPADALRCFCESWKIRPYHNAAKFHVQDLYAFLKDILQKALSHLLRNRK